MARGETAAVVTAVAALAVVAWLVSLDGGGRLRAQLSVAGGHASAGDRPVTLGSPVRTGIVPDKWVPHVPPGAHLGPHRIYRHPARCSPNLTAPDHVAYDWLYSPPSEGTL